MTSQRKLLIVWFCVGVIPLILQIRGYLKFASPHKIPESVIVPPGTEPKTDNLLELCPMTGLHVGQVWWNVAMTHYYELERGIVCHFVIPQYNSHGDLAIGRTKVAPFYTAPSSCVNESYPAEMFIYHGSIGYFSLYDELVSTYCTEDKTAYSHTVGVGTYDINGMSLSQHFGSDGYRLSYWYCIVGASWIVFRGLIIRRCYLVSKHYGARCDQMGVILERRAATIFIYENLRLSAHGATNYQRAVLLYLLVEGIMSDLFLVAATDGAFIWLQYVSLGYNLSGVLLLIFEMVESMSWLRENYRLFVKRLLFSYEASLIGELLNAIWQSYLLSSLNRSDLQDTNSVSLAVSYYLWNLGGHGAIVLCFVAFIMSVRIVIAVIYVRWKHGRIVDILCTPCCVDTTYGVRNKMTKLSGYLWEDGKLYYKADALKAFGLLRMEESGKEFLVLNKLHWFGLPTNDFRVIGSVADDRVEPCSERPCAGVIGFFDRNLGGPLGDSERFHSVIVRRRSSVLPSLSTNVLPT